MIPEIIITKVKISSTNPFSIHLKSKRENTCIFNKPSKLSVKRRYIPTGIVR